jgi:4-amino-4-deoxy-L-arabinose transferase-like glycosyltransferase
MNVSFSVSVLSVSVRRVAIALGVVVLGVLAFVNLTTYPAMWFDEGVHLHVPKAIVRYGVYADYSSEGFRFYGPTMSVGPTVMLPIALAFKAAGIGLLQARLVMVAYMLAAIALAWVVGRQLGDRALAWWAVALLVSSRAVNLVFYGRQLLGEVPGFAFLLAGLWCWFEAWERTPPPPTLTRTPTPTPMLARADGARWLLIAAGLLFGLAVVTKYQYIIVLAPGLAVVWLVDRLRYRLLPLRAIVWPAALLIGCFAAWQLLAVLDLGPAQASDNLQTMRRATAGAALSFSAAQMRRAATEVVTPAAFSCVLLPALAYAVWRARARSFFSLRWIAIASFITVDLIWFVTASIGWRRYAFAAFALGAFPVALLVRDLITVATAAATATATATATAAAAASASASRRRVYMWSAAAALVIFTIVAPLALTVRDVLSPPPDTAHEMARHLNLTVPPGAVVETWEPEMGFLTDHRYHYPPPALLIDAVAHIWSGGQSPADRYDFRSQEPEPDYVLEGPFTRWIGLYPESRLKDGYALETTCGGYALYARKPLGRTAYARP